MSAITVRDYREDPVASVGEIPAYTTVRFELPGGRRVDVRIEGEDLEVRSIDGPLAVVPRASNTVYLRTEEF